MQTLKKCSDCDRELALDAFNRNRAQPDGLQNICRDCQRERGQRPESRVARAKARRTEHAKALEAERQRRYWATPKGKERSLRAVRKALKDHPERFAAREAVRRAVAKGALPPVRSQSCVHCRGAAQQYHHHRGYARAQWLEVLPICRLCHRRVEHPIPRTYE